MATENISVWKLSDHGASYLLVYHRLRLLLIRLLTYLLNTTKSGWFVSGASAVIEITVIAYNALSWLSTRSSRSAARRSIMKSSPLSHPVNTKAQKNASILHRSPQMAPMRLNMLLAPIAVNMIDLRADRVVYMNKTSTAVCIVA